MAVERPTAEEVAEATSHRAFHEAQLARYVDVEPPAYKPSAAEVNVGKRKMAAKVRQHDAMGVRLRYARTHGESYWDIRPSSTGRLMTLVYGSGPLRSSRRGWVLAALCWATVLAVGGLAAASSGLGAGIVAAAVIVWLIGLLLLKDNLSFTGFLVALAVLGFQFGPTGFSFLFGSFRSHWFGAVVFMLVPLFVNGGAVRQDLFDKKRRRVLASWYRWSLYVSVLPALAVSVWVLRETILVPTKPGTPTTSVSGAGAVLAILLIVVVVVVVTTLTWPPCAGAVRACLRIVAGIGESGSAAPPLPARNRRLRVFYTELDAQRAQNYAI